MARYLCWKLMIGAGFWAIVLLPFCLTPLVLILLPGYALTAAYWL